MIIVRLRSGIDTFRPAIGTQTGGVEIALRRSLSYTDLYIFNFVY
jgi:hypothetical protein